MKKYQTMAINIAKKVQDKITNKGGYENAGQIEINRFMDKVRASNLHYQEQCKLNDFINNLIDNLKY